MHNPDPQLDRLIGTAELATLLGCPEVTMLGSRRWTTKRKRRA